MKNPYTCECIRHLLYITSNLLNSPFTPVSSWLRPTSHRCNLTMLSLFLLGPDTMALGAYEITFGICAWTTQIYWSYTREPLSKWDWRLMGKCFAFLPHSPRGQFRGTFPMVPLKTCGIAHSYQFSNLRLYRLCLHFSFTPCPSLISWDHFTNKLST